MKYVMLEITLQGGEAPPFKLPVIFPDKLVHRDMAMNVKTVAWATWPGCRVNVVSAGEIQLGGVECFGESETLQVKSRGERDARTIDVYNYFHGIEVDA